MQSSETTGAAVLHARPINSTNASAANSARDGEVSRPLYGQTTSRQPCDYLFKFILIGDAGTGKSCLLHQFIENKFSSETSHTIGVEFGSKALEVNDKMINLQIWDTAGQERYRSVTRSYYRGAVGALIVFDIADRYSFEHAVQWINDARTLARADISIICIGNKMDLRAHRQVTFLEASRFCQENDSLFMETSALTGEGVEAAFVRVVKTILAKLEDGRLNPYALTSGVLSSTMLSGTTVYQDSQTCPDSSYDKEAKGSSCACS